MIFEIPHASHTPVRFRETEYIGVGTYRKKLRDFSEKERELWRVLSRTSFEEGIAKADRTDQDVLQLLDYPAYFDLTGQPLPTNRAGILDRLEAEQLVVAGKTGGFDVTNLGGILFAKNLENLGLARKGVRVVVYQGTNRVRTLREQAGNRGYASGFQGLIEFINAQLPQNEQLEQALRIEQRMYPEVAIRELVANALIHQDFALTGTGPMVEIFEDRIEMTNPGMPLIETDRFLDAPPMSRNDALASLMRRLKICEERGSGIDKVIFSVEVAQLPPPDFSGTGSHTRAILFAHRPFSRMSRKDRIRACYQHASLLYVSGQEMTNATLRRRFLISDENYATASRIIADTVRARLIKPRDPSNRSRKHAKYIPFWA